jgi:hypothetical protein
VFSLQFEFQRNGPVVVVDVKVSIAIPLEVLNLVDGYYLLVVWGGPRGDDKLMSYGPIVTHISLAEVSTTARTDSEDVLSIELSKVSKFDPRVCIVPEGRGIGVYFVAQ